MTESGPLSHQLTEENFSGPLDCMTGLPNIAYNSDSFSQFERDHVLAKSWICIANEAQLHKNGWLHPVNVLDLPILVIRGRDGLIRVFHNVCSHRGMKLVKHPDSLTASLPVLIMAGAIKVMAYCLQHPT